MLVQMVQTVNQEQAAIHILHEQIQLLELILQKILQMLMENFILEFVLIILKVILL